MAMKVKQRACVDLRLMQIGILYVDHVAET